MMKMIGRVTSCCVALFLALTSVSAVQRINLISDLKNIPFGQSVPEHSLVLLHWFANTVEIENNVIWLNFEPNEDYGSHHYGNFDELLDPLPWGHQYYTIGNVNQASSRELPSYVVNHRTAHMGGNRARIIIGVEGLNTGRRRQRINHVYITQHIWPFQYERTGYDSQHTYEISTNLLRELRQFPLRDNQSLLNSLRHGYASSTYNFQSNNIRNTWGNLEMQNMSNQFSYRQQSSQNQENALQNCCMYFLLVLLFVVVLFLFISLQPKSTWPSRW